MKAARSKWFYLLFAIIMMIIIWETNRNSVILAQTEIPQDSIRLRILANSDSPLDQQIKRDVRDALVDQMNEWVKGPTSLEEARQIVRDRMPELGERAQSVLTAYGTSYGYKIELGQVPFPTKVYGGAVYPAGDYEALRVTLGSGEGQNWWCVLFPPLCFVDGVTGDAVSEKSMKASDKSAKAKATPAPKQSAVRPTVMYDRYAFESDVYEEETTDAWETSYTTKSTKSSATAYVSTAWEPEKAAEAPETEYRFFLVDWVRSWF